MPYTRHFFLWLIPLPFILGFCLLCGASGFGLPDISSATGRALLELRLCRLATAFVVGAALACSGCALQAVLRNALAEPYVLGISSGGSLGAALIIITGLANLTPLALPAGAFIAAALTLLLVCLISSRNGNYMPGTLILTGVVAGSMLSSLLMLLLSFAQTRAIHSITWWMMGNLQTTSWSLLGTVAMLVTIALIILIIEARALNALLLGHEAAHNLGVATRLTIPLTLAAATLAASAAVAISGIIGFVGLIIPHTLRGLIGADHRRLLPCCALFGGVFLTVCDTLARTLCAPHEIPVGVITALAGGPFFLHLLTRRDKLSNLAQFH